MKDCYIVRCRYHSRCFFYSMFQESYPLAIERTGPVKVKFEPAIVRIVHNNQPHLNYSQQSEI